MSADISLNIYIYTYVYARLCCSIITKKTLVDMYDNKLDNDTPKVGTEKPFPVGRFIRLWFVLLQLTANGHGASGEYVRIRTPRHVSLILRTDVSYR